MNKLSPSQIKFLTLVQETCSELGVNLILADAQGVEFQNTGIMCNGYFVDTPSPTLAVAIKKDIQDWFLVLLHEYCHLEQWAEKSSSWLNNKLQQGEASDLIDSWLNHQTELDEQTLDKIFQINIDLESDCEKRAIHNIIKFNLDINHQEYAQKANSYVLFYHLVKKHRKWYKIGQEPYSLKEVWSKMPNHMNLDYTQIAPELSDVLEKCF